MKIFEARTPMGDPVQHSVHEQKLPAAIQGGKLDEWFCSRTGSGKLDEWFCSRTGTVLHETFHSGTRIDVRMKRSILILEQDLGDEQYEQIILIPERSVTRTS